MNTIKDSVDSIGEALNRHVDVISASAQFSNHVPVSFIFTEENVKTVTRLPGASNITYKVEFEGAGKPLFIVYRRFMNKLVDFRIENLIFQKLSDQRQGPHCFYQCTEYRIEEYIPSRTVTIFELRNPTFIKHLARQFAHFHGNKSIQEGVLELLTENTSAESPKTCLETFLDNWWKQIYDRLELLRSNLHREDYKSILDDFISVYYFPNFEEYWKELLPQSTDKVVAHTDMQETNILVLKPTPFEKDNLKLMIIDYEYAGLVERSWDLANYYIETMLSNGEYDSYPWVEYFEENGMQQNELELLVDEYVYAVAEFDQGVELDRDRLLGEVRSMAIAINYYWGAWAMVSVDLDEVNHDNLYFPAAKIRLRMISKLKQMFQ